MILPNNAVLKIEGHAFPTNLPVKHLKKFSLWVACAEELPPFDVAQERMLTLWCPLDDCDPMRMVDYDMAKSAAVLVARELLQKHHVLVTCAMGLNRSSLVAGLALRKLGFGGYEAIAAIQQERGPDALHNHAFAAAIVRG